MEYGSVRSSRLLVLFALLGFAVPAHAAETVVDQHDLMFDPNAVTIQAGDTVRFTDTDRITHNITITYPDGTVEDKGMDRYKEDIIVHFTKPGVYQVHCLIHPMMRMTVTVK
jgi:plastocyanin